MTRTRITINRRAALAGITASAGAALLAACGGTEATPSLTPRIIPSPNAIPPGMPQGPATCTSGTIAIDGSTALKPLIDAATRAYIQKCSGAQITVAGNGSSVGLGKAQAGLVQIGMADIFAEEQSAPVPVQQTGPSVTVDAKQLQDFQLVVQGFAIVTNAKGGPDSLTLDQLLAVFTGQVQNFSSVGGPSSAITVVTREKGSGSRAIFERYGLKGQATKGRELNSNGDLANAVLQTPGAIGYVGLATFNQTKGLKLVLLDGREPSVENISDNSYPIWSYGHLYTKTPAATMPTPTTKTLTQAFLDYLLSDDVQTTLIPPLGYIPVSRVKSRKTP